MALADELAKLRRRYNALQSLANKVKAIRALYVTVFNQNAAIDSLSTEFFHAVGEILEGRSEAQINLRLIDKQTFMTNLGDD